ncbi:MAG: cytochrome c3 family protein [Thermodesulfobacteriota bacterium]
MKRVGFIYILFVGFVFAALVGCRTQEAPEWGWKADRPRTTRETFSHDVHKKVLEKEGFGCFICHTTDVEIDEYTEPEEMIQISEQAFFPGKDTCHFCHYNPQAGNIAPDRCGICHFNTREIQPPNHNFDWVSRHAVFSKADSKSCEDCHSPRFCEDCHKRRDLPTRRVHDRNFRFVHAIEARANPRTCGTCHQLSAFCEKCHIEGGYER